MTNPICPFCQHQVLLFLQTSDINRHLASDIFNYYRCENCGVIFQYPIAPNLSFFYQNDYYRIPQSREQLQLDSEAYRYKLETLQQFVTGKKILEIGSGYGDFAFLVRQAGYEIDVIEMDADCCRFLQDVIGINATQSNDPAHALEQMGQYDAIVLWQVIEHLQDPAHILDVMSNHLKPEGILLLAAPNPNSLQFKLFGRNWAHFDAPRHLQFIPISTMANYMLKRGLKLVSVSTNDLESRKANTFGWKKSIMNVLGITVTAQTSSDENKSDVVHFGASNSLKYLIPRAILRFFIRVIELFGSSLERTGLRGSSYTIVFSKPIQ